MADDVPRLRPAMNGKEIKKLASYMAGAKSYVEFGCGGSTLLAVQSPVERAWSVESDIGWIDRIRSHPEIASAEASGRLKLLHVDIGPTKGYGYPTRPWWLRLIGGGRGKWPAYYESIWSLAAPAEADLFLVDGRFRVACGLSVAARCRDEALVAVHDFNNRPEYQTLLEVYDKVDEVRNLVILKRKPSGAERAGALMERFRYKPD